MVEKLLVVLQVLSKKAKNRKQFVILKKNKLWRFNVKCATPPIIDPLKLCKNPAFHKGVADQKWNFLIVLGGNNPLHWQLHTCTDIYLQNQA